MKWSRRHGSEPKVDWSEVGSEVAGNVKVVAVVKAYLMEDVK